MGEVEAIDDDYYGVAVNQTARLRAIAHGGQTVVSSVAAMLAATMLTNRVDLQSLGHHRIRDFARVEEVFQASPLGSSRAFPPLRTVDTHGPALMAIAIVDICSAGRIVQQLDEREVVALNLGWARSMRKLGDVHGATALRVFGDGCVAAFEDPLDCVAFAQDFRASAAAEGFEMKAGIDVGRVELSDGEIVGTAVYRASRLERDAEPGSDRVEPVGERARWNQRVRGKPRSTRTRRRVGPARGDDLGAGVEVDALGAVHVAVAEQRRLPAAEAE